jgi:hypothetical protein
VQRAAQRLGMGVGGAAQQRTVDIEQQQHT